MIVSTQTMPITKKVGEAEAIRLIAQAGFDAYDITLNVIEGNPIFEDNSFNWIKRKAFWNSVEPKNCCQNMKFLR